MTTARKLVIELDPTFHRQFLPTLDGYLERVTEAVGKAARANAPVLTGELRDSIRWHVERGVGAVEAGARYALAVETGTGDTEPQAFLRPALSRLPRG